MKIKTNNYEIIKDSGVNYLEKIKPNTNIETLKENITTNGTIEIYKDNMKVIDEKQLIATPLTLKKVKPMNLPDNPNLFFDSVLI